jgi:ubiquinone/menaquinone biosynthesis C-methylase UbiE
MYEEARRMQSELEATRRHYNRIAGIYDYLEILDEGSYRPWRRELLARASGKVLEIGVGTGKNFPYYPPGVNLVGVDIAEKMLGPARERALKMKLPVQLMVADVQDLDFRDDTFDTAASTFVFCSVPDPVRGLRELRRVVRPDGRILLLEHVRNGPTKTASLMGFFNPLVAQLFGPNIENHLTLGMIEQAGLLMESIKHLGDQDVVKMIVARPGKQAR